MTDFASATPASALSDKPCRDKWRIVPWTTQDLSGRLLWSMSDCKRALRVPLNASGWHAISLGLFGQRIRLRLSGETVWSDCWFRPGTPAYTFQEQFWRLADLTGKRLEICAEDFPLSHERDFVPGSSTVVAPAFVRLIPLTQKQVRKAKESPPIPWLGTNDGHGVFAAREDPPSRAVTARLDGFRDSNWKDVSWCLLGADIVNYRTRVGTIFGGKGAFPRQGVQSAIAENLWRLLERGQDPTELAIRRARRNGMAIWIGHRLQAYAMPPPHDGTFNSRFRFENPQWACRTRNGEALMQMSFAFPPVRRHLLEIMAEVVPKGADGIHLIFNRGLPCTYFEEPVVREFRKRHRADVRRVDPLDSRVVALRAEYVTRYIEELQALLRDKGRGHMRIAANVLPTKEMNDEFGFDAEGWARSGLVSRLLPFRWEHRWDTPLDTDFWRRLRRETGCEIWPFAYNNNRERHDLPRQHRERALALFRQGFDGLAAWDPRPWMVELGLDRAGELEVWEEVSSPLPPQRLRTQGPFVVDECPPIYGF